MTEFSIRTSQPLKILIVYRDFGAPKNLISRLKHYVKAQYQTKISNKIC